MRRNLQREHVARLARLVLGPKRNASLSLTMLLFDSDFGVPAPPDARSLARQHLHQIDARIQGVLGAKDQKIDAASLAHLQELHEQIEKVFGAKLEAGEL